MKSYIDKAIDYFSEKELACKGTGIIRLDPFFADELVRLRETWDNALHPTSICRTPEYNEKIGGHPRSLHLTSNPKWDTNGTAAADIRWENWFNEDRVDFIELAWENGWSIGLHPSFIHLDRREDFGGTQSVFKYPVWSEDLDYVLV